MLPGLDPVHKISIVQRGFGALGYTMQLPLEDRYLMTRGDLLSQLAVLLGGRTAEEIALGEISTGAQNDLLRATDIARAMVTEFGMSDALGAINYDGNKRARFLDLPMQQERGMYGEETAQKIDAEIKRILTDAHDTARRVLEENRDKLETVTRRLLEVEVMEGDELRSLLGIQAASARRTPSRSPSRIRGTTVTRRPPTDPDVRHLPHPAPTSGDDAKPHERIRMADAHGRNPSGDVAPHPMPRQMALAAASEHTPPEATHRSGKREERRVVHRHAVVLDVTPDDRAHIRAEFREGLVHATPKFQP